MANKVRYWRQRRGMSIAELARRAGVTRTTIYRAERDQLGNPSLKTLTAIAQALEVNADAIFFNDGV